MIAGHPAGLGRRLRVAIPCVDAHRDHRDGPALTRDGKLLLTVIGLSVLAIALVLF
ncbi:hypothetical protein [Dermabacter sp. HSID17554]|uniref:hypothetical protein n=1 Tax=Dermabacter sp. HSID17554 TaxID=2419511 RepID=UPI0012938FD8|nr:hypothetical protein [Dermabacter sp. HSID17554]